jgi:hypothetical protein
LWLGLVPLLVVGTVVLTVLAVRLPAERAPLTEATAVAVARVVEAGRPPGGRGVVVAFPDSGRTRTGLLVLADPVAVQPGAEVTVRYDPDDDPDATGGPSTIVYADGDAASRAVGTLTSGMAIVAGVLAPAAAWTGLVVLTRRRLRRRSPGMAAATRLVVRRGLLVRSWLELETSRGLSWVPVFWTAELAGLAAGTRIELRGDPSRDRLVLPVVGGAEVWPSGRVRARAPRGEQRAPRGGSPAAGIGMARQVRVDAVVALAAPLLGLLWAYVDGSGVAGFAAATALSAVVLFWLFQLLGSDPEAPARE